MAQQFSFKRCWKQSAHLRIGLVLFALVLLYLGRFVEVGSTEEVLSHPAHPIPRRF